MRKIKKKIKSNRESKYILKFYLQNRRENSISVEDCNHLTFNSMSNRKFDHNNLWELPFIYDRNLSLNVSKKLNA